MFASIFRYIISCFILFLIVWNLHWVDSLFDLKGMSTCIELLYAA